MYQEEYKRSYVPRKLKGCLDQVIEMYKIGEPVNYIARKFNCDRQTVRNVMKRLGIERVPELKVSEGEGVMLRSSEWLRKREELKRQKEIDNRNKNYYKFLVAGEKKKKEDIRRMENCKHRVIKNGSCWVCGISIIEPTPAGGGWLYNKFDKQGMV